ncbi:amidophosphoribosyltransferase [Neoehrlichia mikurensis]|uniref:Amidophosphoribosyltransferase n=1 Tax=Neoehrlichia mikurensis TaxID=89586 RepID=A0A9Q9C204_9RICK|nr:amidophosphoribosyltransferase [Neoehrlichia mikurensis]QXK92254.1 amidophosphoribosyltransferase [Neoehrlichia mikurensis]QXK92708.1 amidophosphoribosyltransferase [Neoehrlichia mikurensis]QXK93946.1 amidophosphoribosyltransferase [Neoehrlichia mikurensis]UTO55889.1 amidophosphoribosyltransferase [Neoehrlichia mikurensis]UTO56805.1 amidophosphoribosyltransferase [Neoehrlichia mikurensis]
MPFNEIHEECGVFAIKNNRHAGLNCILGLHALQHRGQESFGVVTSDESDHDNFHIYHSHGYVNDIFNKANAIDALSGTLSIGHVRYSTSGDKMQMQPIITNCKFGKLAIAHNGNLINTEEIRHNLIKQGYKFSSKIDTELIANLIAISSEEDFINSIIFALKQIKGAYSLVIMTKNTLIGVRDPSGIRPLTLGICKKSYALASETCAFNITGFTTVRDIKPGELIIINKDNKVTSLFPLESYKPSFCIFEYVYFARPDSIMANQSIYEIRKNIGIELSIENPPPNDTDMIVPVPDSGIPAAIGYSSHTKIPFEFGIIRNHYVGRTFIQPTAQTRNMSIQLKHSANSSVLKNKSIVLIDDSIVRGTTLKSIISLLRKAGAKYIHLRISSPPTKYSCFYGIDTPNASQLIANNFSIAELVEILQCDSLAFLSIDGLYKAICNTNRNMQKPQYCDACFTGEYPIGK